MEMQPLRPKLALALIGFIVLLGFTLACARTQGMDSPSFWSISGRSAPATAVVDGVLVVGGSSLPANHSPDTPILTPTPDDPHPLPSIRTDPELYAVQAGDTLGDISNRYGVGVDALVQANELIDPNLLGVGQELIIPAPTPEGSGPDFKIIPNSELIYGPSSIGFDIEEFVQKQGGYLSSYREEVDEESLSGAQIVDRVARDFSVNPRLLLAVLEHQSGWLTNPNPPKANQEYPIGLLDPNRKSLYRQMTWTANNLNRGFYLWRVNGIATWLLGDGSLIPIAPTINAGTAAVQQFYALLYDRADWEDAVSMDGLFATYNQLFGYPFDYAIEPSLPPNIAQPTMQLPFEAGTEWAFTGGPHGGWGDGAAWAALDFAPPGEAVGCVESNDWVVAVADGLILRAANGAVIQDLDGDGLEQTGWVVLYMHIETRERVQPGTYLKVGEQVGHPSCEGGVSSGTHVHLARRYNGEWIPADQNIPFILDGWVSSGTGDMYDGYLRRGGQIVEAYAGRSPNNGIQR